MKRGIRILVLIITYIILVAPLRFIFRIKSNSKYIKINKNKKYIIVANHPSKLDPFLVLAVLPLKIFIKLTPINFVISEDYLKKWYYKYLLKMWGCISNIKRDNKKPLAILKEKLNNNETVFLFPGGELEKKGKLGTPKIGAIYLEREVKNSFLLPIKIEMSNKINLLNLLKRNIKTKIEIKKEFRNEKFQKNLQPLADELYKRITS